MNMEALATQTLNHNELDFGGAVAPSLSGTAKSNITFHKKALPTALPGLPTSGSDLIVDRVHEIENLTKADALTRVDELEDRHEMTYFEIGGVLSVIWKNGWFDPYSSFDEWVENKTAMRRAKARALIQIYDAIANSGVTWEQVKHIRWTKPRAIARVLTKENASHWIELASNHLRMELKALVKNHLAATGTKIAGASNPTHVKTFKFHDDQHDTVEAAIEKAKKSSGTPYDSAALEFVCLDYLGGQTKAQRLRAVGPVSGAKAVIDAYAGEALNAFVKSVGVEKLLQAISDAAPNLDIGVLDKDDDFSSASE